MVKRSWRSFLAGILAVGGMAAGSAAYAQDGCTPCGTGCDECAGIFADAGQKLTDQLASMTCCGSCTTDACADPCAELLGCGDECGEGCGEGLFGDTGSGIEIGGWFQFGYHSDITPLSTQRNQGFAFNDHPHRVNLHQGWLYAEKVADGSCGMDWGFRADVMYGVDAGQTQAFGNNPGRWDFDGDPNFTRGAGYGWALPQLYAELASGDWSVKAGHFYTLIGYEVVTAPDNFFYSHALTMFNSEPFTHSGVLATYTASDELEIYGGWTAGWDTGFDQLRDGSSFLGGASYSVSDDVTLTYITTAGNFGWRGKGYSHSIVLDMALTDSLNYVIQSDLVRTDDNDANPATLDADDDVGINQYLIYSLNDQVGVGSRLEWWKNEGVSNYAATFGLNVKPMDNLIIRPELRTDWVPGADFEQTGVGIDAIITW